MSVCQKLLTYDSASAHLAKAVKHEFDKSDTLLSVVPGGLTPTLQCIDTDTAFVFRHNWQVLAHACVWLWLWSEPGGKGGVTI